MNSAPSIDIGPINTAVSPTKQKKPRELLPREIRVDTGIRTLGLQSHNLAR